MKQYGGGGGSGGGGGGALFVVVAIEVHFQAIDLPLGNVFCFLTGPWK